ncbi:hypothetical protein KSP40_PGU018608 [Platanthera guangdongensis]|uniref:Uncharacterized protein n=1 Tax=Platanthera guangdongensis TaxID=2320717 RepID=A0ABR2MAD9_9ASPA
MRLTIYDDHFIYIFINSEFLAQEGYSNFATKSETDNEIGIMVMINGDNVGLVLPPKVTEVQIIVNPMFDKKMPISKPSMQSLQPAHQQFEHCELLD